MEIPDEELDKMYSWINNSMKENTWYPVKSDKAYDILLRLFNEGMIDFCEFDENQTHIRKINQKLLGEE
jgi:hypothetical protein